jgi:hypothetical protein
MIFLLTGEGASDIGICHTYQEICGGADFRAGPMAVVIDKLIEPVAGYSLLNCQALEFISERTLSDQSRQLPMAISAGKKRDFETAYFFKGARALAKAAKGRQAAMNCPVGAVMFRDADGTRSTERGLFEAKCKSIEDGFRAEAFEHGVPMIPKPKSEVWLLCALKDQSYQGCALLEDSISGNDNSEVPAKALLEQRLLEQGKTVNDLAEMVETGAIDCARIDMPSFNRFRQRLEEVSQNLFAASRPT